MNELERDVFKAKQILDEAEIPYPVFVTVEGVTLRRMTPDSPIEMLEGDGVYRPYLPTPKGWIPSAFARLIGRV